MFGVERWGGRGENRRWGTSRRSRRWVSPMVSQGPCARRVYREGAAAVPRGAGHCRLSLCSGNDARSIRARTQRGKKKTSAPAPGWRLSLSLSHAHLPSRHAPHHHPHTRTQLNKIPKNYTADWESAFAKLSKPSINKTELIKGAMKLAPDVGELKAEAELAVSDKLAKLGAEVDAIEVREERAGKELGRRKRRERRVRGRWATTHPPPLSPSSSFHAPPPLLSPPPSRRWPRPRWSSPTRRPSSRR